MIKYCGLHLLFLYIDIVSYCPLELKSGFELTVKMNNNMKFGTPRPDEDTVMVKEWILKQNGVLKATAYNQRRFVPKKPPSTFQALEDLPPSDKT